MTSDKRENNGIFISHRDGSVIGGSQSMAMVENLEEVTEFECLLMRFMRHYGLSVTMISSIIERQTQTVSVHVNGYCQHDNIARLNMKVSDE